MYEISVQNFKKATGEKYPYEQKNDSTNIITQYAICPSCLNPIQIIGLIRKTKVNPYGKHTGKDVDDLAKWNQIKYEFCPYATPNKRRDIDNDWVLIAIEDITITEDVVELYNLLKDNFDKVVYFISKKLDVKCSERFWEDALEAYLVNRYYLYPWLTENNLPYIFASIGMTHCSIYKQRFKADSDIHAALSKLPNVKFQPSMNDDFELLSRATDQYLNMEFRFYKHRQNGIDGKELYESMHFCIDDLSDGKIRTVFEKEIVFEQHHFMNLVNAPFARDQRLLDIAAILMQPLEVSE